MKQYLDLLQRIISDGQYKDETRGQPTMYRFDERLRVSLDKGAPIITTRKVRWKNLIVELLWLISGEGSIEPMLKEDVSFWKPWADENGRIESYGQFWRSLPISIGESGDIERRRANLPVSFKDGKPFLNPSSHKFIHEENEWWGFDQLAYVIWLLKNQPYSRRIKLDQWVPQNAFASSLPPCPCHILFDVLPPKENVEEPTLNLQVWQRSADVPVGVTYNLGVYGTFGILMANEVGMRPGEISFSFTNAHIYEDQIADVLRQIRRKPLNRPYLMTNIEKPMVDWEVSDYEKFAIVDYSHHAPIHYSVQK